MKKGLFTICMILFIATNSFGQNDETLFNQFNFRLTGAWGGTIAGASKIGDNFSPTSGGYGILEFDKQFLLGWGGFEVNDRVEFGDDSYSYDLDYNGFMIGYTPQSFRVVHPRVMALVGSGSSRIDGDRDRTPVLQLEGGAEFNIFRWFRVSANGGYRFLLDIDDVPAGISSTDLSGIYGELKFQFGWSWGKS
ncbi:MAG: hypothetical protein AB8G22_27495 [Saprospiraceae bacterium]